MSSQLIDICVSLPVGCEQFHSGLCEIRRICVFQKHICSYCKIMGKVLWALFRALLLLGNMDESELLVFQQHITTGV